MSIYITGDTHGTIDWEKLNTRNFPEQKTMDPEKDFVIILGDFGGVWDGSSEDKYVIKNYDQRNFTTLFIDGNHENHDLLDNYPVEEWHGGKVHKISERVIHLMRGQVFEIGGLKFFTMGGAESIDKYRRKEGISWWPRELPSDEEYEEALRNLGLVNFKVDYVLTHRAPERYLAYHMPGIVDACENRLTEFFDSLIQEHGLDFTRWYFGHYHRDINWDAFSLVYWRIRKIEGGDS